MHGRLPPSPPQLPHPQGCYVLLSGWLWCQKGGGGGGGGDEVRMWLSNWRCLETPVLIYMTFVETDLQVIKFTLPRNSRSALLDFADYYDYSPLRVRTHFSVYPRDRCFTDRVPSIIHNVSGSKRLLCSGKHRVHGGRLQPE